LFSAKNYPEIFQLSWFNLGNASRLAQTLDASKAARLCESAWSLPAVVGWADCGKMDLLFSITLLCCNIVMQVPWLKQNAEPRALSFGPFWDWNSKQLMCQHGLIIWKSLEIHPQECDIEFGPLKGYQRYTPFFQSR
jgi:hypothetical protein